MFTMDFADTLETPPHIIYHPPEACEDLAPIRETNPCIAAQDSPAQVVTPDPPLSSASPSPELSMAETTALPQPESPVPALAADVVVQQPAPDVDRSIDRRVVPRSLGGSDILFCGDSIRKLLQDTPAMPVHLNAFLAILERSPALAICHKHISIRVHA